MNQNNIIGKALDELYRVFDILNKSYYSNKLPIPVITIQKAKREGNTGWCSTRKVWENKITGEARFETNICPEYLNRESHEIIETLQHEMVHLFYSFVDVNDCSGSVHNKKFKDLAEKVGLIVEKSKKYGYGHTTCSPEFEEFIKEEIKLYMTAFEYFRTLPKKEAKPPKEKKTFKYTCPQCNSEVKGKKDKNVKCGDCEVTMEMEEE